MNLADSGDLQRPTVVAWRAVGGVLLGSDGADLFV